MTIDFDIQDLVNELSLPKNTADLILSKCVEDVTNAIYEEWKKSASDSLKSTRTDYVEGLDIIQHSQFHKQIVLRGVLNNMIEQGASPFDMKIGMLSSSKVKFSHTYNPDTEQIEQRPYLTVPFRIGVPTTIGESSSFANIMPKEVHKVAVNLTHKQQIPSSQIPSPYNIPQARAKIVIPETNVDIPEYTHKTSLFAGMQKNVGAYGKTTQNTYNTFRRISEASDDNSWIHRGIKAYDLLGKSLKNTDVGIIVENTTDEVLVNLGYGKQ